MKLNGGDIKSVQGDSGHAQVKMVTDVYSHIIDEDRRLNAKRFEDANKKLEDKDIKIKSLEKERDELKKELAANNEVMKQVVEKIQRAGGR